MVYRSANWMVDPNLAWGAFFKKMIGSRLAELMVHKPGEGFVLSLLATVLTPMRWLMAKLAETYYRELMPMRKHGMAPAYSLSESMLLGWRIGLLPDRFYDMVDQGGIVLRRCDSFGFCADGLELDDGTGERVGADVVILATGFDDERLLSSVFVSPWFREIIVPKPSHTMLPFYRSVRRLSFKLLALARRPVRLIDLTMYISRSIAVSSARHCVHPRIPQMAVVCYVESAASIYPYEMMAKWVAHLLDGVVRLPSVAAMEENVAEWERWGRWAKRRSGAFFVKSCIAAVTTWYSDQLCRDMGRNPRRKRRGLLADWLQPYGPSDYAGIQ
jgi:dimethylaniline monooxygenase (N-oxide forming)